MSQNKKIGDLPEREVIADEDYLVVVDTTDTNIETRTKKAKAKNFKGDKGDKGDTGAVGPQGAQGVKGDKGDKGDQGSVGPQGDQGNPGPAGERGPRGYTGAEGPKGEKGETGSRGPRGYTGETGPKGDTGADGQPGPAGADGQPGADGAPGADGREVEFQKSATHIQWRYVGDTEWTNLVALADIKGDQGSAGADGNTILSGSGAPGAGLGVDGDFYIDTANDAIYGPKSGGNWGNGTSLVGPQGEQGEKGDTGNTGATGPQGPAGPGVASGGAAGKFLKKKSETDYDTEWGDEADPVFNAWSQKSVVEANASLWSQAVAWGNHALAGYVKQDSNPVWTGQHIFDSKNQIAQVDSSVLGSELITNGAFTGNANNWVLNSGWRYISNLIEYYTSGGSSAYQQNLLLSNVALGDILKLVYTLSDVTAGGVYCGLFGNSTPIRTVAGTYVEYIAVTNLTYKQVTFFPSVSSARFKIDNVSLKKVTNGGNLLGLTSIGSTLLNNLNIFGNQSNYAPGTTQMINLINAGTYSYINAVFSDGLKSSIGFASDGSIRFYAGVNGIAFYYGIGSPFNFANLTQGAFIHGQGYIAAQFGLSAGYTGYPTSKLYTAGGFGAKVKKIIASQTLDDSATVWLCDATNASVCSGTPTYACSHWTNQGDCQAYDAHGGCTWSSGSGCGEFNGDIGNCQSHSGCTADESACTGGDQQSCEANDDAYGGNCAWSQIPIGCTYGWDESTCNAYSCTPEYNGSCANYNGQQGNCEGTSGCSWYDNSCSSYNYDQGNCEANGCYYDAGNGNCLGVCSGSYYTGCNGTYYDYACTGNYYTGNCSGNYGANCFGTPSCSGIDDSGNCNAEPGCSWSSVLNITLPDGESCPDRHYFIKNISSGGADVVINPYTGQKVEGQNYHTLPDFNDYVHIAYFKDTASCDGKGESDCQNTSGCSPNYSGCTWDSENSVCTGTSGCEGYGDQGSCESAQIYTGCGGSYVLQKNWYII